LQTFPNSHCPGPFAECWQKADGIQPSDQITRESNLTPPFPIAEMTMSVNPNNRLVKINKRSKINRLIDYLQSMNDAKFTGYIKVNFSQGHIGRVEKFEEVLKKS
jgi:hypothetical protein